jgi:hypothetical protein
VTNHPTGLLDTSTVILLPRLRDPGVLPDAPLISAVTLGELSVGPLVAMTDAERAARLAHLLQAEADFEPCPSMQSQPEPSVRSLRRCNGPVGRCRPAPTMQ